MMACLRSREKIYKISICIVLVISILVLVHLAPNLIKPEYLPSDDFFQFWAGGYQNLHGQNPFDPVAINHLRVQQGSPPTSTKIPVMLNPPWTITFSMLFGLFDYPISRLTWLLLSIAIVLASTLVLWHIYTGKPKQRWLAILVVFIYAPTISVLEKGQLSILVLLGLTGFLYFTTVKRNDWLAGVCLFLVSTKPQLVLLFWFAVILWVIQKRQWVILMSTAITVVGMNIIPLVFNPQVIQQYFIMLHSYGISEWANPTIGAYLRFFWLGTDKFWLQFLPSVIAIAWFLFYWSRHNQSWNWIKELPMILLVSLVTSPYAWTYDQVVLVPVIIQAAVWVVENRKHWSAIIFSLLFLVFSFLDLILHMKLDEFWFIWLAPATLVWYIAISLQYKSHFRGSRISIQSNG